MLEEFIYSFLENRKKIFGGIIGFVISILLVSLGFFATVFVVIMTIIGYNLGNRDFSIILNKFKSMLSVILNKIDTN